MFSNKNYLELINNRLKEWYKYFNLSYDDYFKKYCEENDYDNSDIIDFIKEENYEDNFLVDFDEDYDNKVPCFNSSHLHEKKVHMILKNYFS